MGLNEWEFITCPGCQRKLPAGARSCHFCGVDVSKVARAAGPAKKVYQEYETPKWIVSLYWALCAWWCLGGVLQIVEVYRDYLSRQSSTSIFVEKSFGAYDAIGIAFGAVGILVGLGLALKVKFIRKYVNFICGLNILFGLLSLAGSLASILLVGALGVIFVISNIVDIIVAAATIWLLSETSNAMWED